MSKKAVYRKGPPPSLGFWPTLARSKQASRPIKAIRWWDGEAWSVPLLPDDSIYRVNAYASVRTAFANSDVRWTDRPDDWPARSRT